MSRLIDADALLQKFNDKGIQIAFDLPVEEMLGEDVDIDDFTMLVQDAIQAYRKMVIGTIKEQPTVKFVTWIDNKLEQRKNRIKEGRKVGMDGDLDLSSYNNKLMTEIENLHKKPKTNAERIRAMSDEELEEFLTGLNEHCLAGIGKIDCSSCNGYCEDNCRKMTRKWLQSESEMEK